MAGRIYLLIKIDSLVHKDCAALVERFNKHLTSLYGTVGSIQASGDFLKYDPMCKEAIAVVDENNYNLFHAALTLASSARGLGRMRVIGLSSSLSQLTATNYCE
eukprot:Gregarina_sp_Poly_1__10493@NODE_76_length_15862_cov_98_864577_g65_i0_p20_GENE_NODE_76_length_15862_cov_98_864577_g65_i0NODE_76_length_15862_cov_98_864577_g65_i0_p20_ORF_typecomplete_len104_score10_40RNase_P_Rpp14/PF01900_19/7_3e06_NODE_76_length_15862_cov_98_864577_g65_i045164827